MLLSDVIKVIGDTPLREYPWGAVVVDTINLFVDVGHQLTDDSTGPDVHRALDSLSDEVKDIVLQANLDTNRRCITAPVGGNMVIEYENTDVDELDFYKASQSPTVIAAGIAVISIVLMAVVMVGSLGMTPSTEVWISIGEVLGLFITAMN